MQRRTLLKLFGGVAVAGLPGVQPPATGGRDRIVVAGGGIIGANIAWALARRGANVTVVERTAPGSGATANSFAWINSTYSKQPWPYFQLNRLGIEAWRQLDRDLPGKLPLRWGGSLEWYADPTRAARFRDEVKHHQAWGYPTEIVDDARLKTLEPKVSFGAVAAAGHATMEGHVDPVRVTELLLAEAATLGARVQHPCEVTGLDQPQGRLRAVKTTTGDIPADVLVVACGVDTPRVAKMAGLSVPLKESPGVLVHTAPLPACIDRVILAPAAHMKQKPDGRVVTGVGFGGTPSKDDSREGGEAFLKTAATVLPALRDAALEKVTLGWRPLPADEFPIVGLGTRPDVYLAVMHSGVTMSPLMGRLAAIEILDGVKAEPLEPYRLARFK
jgi:glycine/D-amino acid oxidase-like deaminating enzyme